jgi:hypothetical protein
MRKRLFISPVESSVPDDFRSRSSAMTKHSTMSKHSGGSWTSNRCSEKSHHCPRPEPKPCPCIPTSTCGPVCHQVLNNCLHRPHPPITRSAIHETIETQQIDVRFEERTIIEYINWLAIVRSGFTQAALGFEAVIDQATLSIRIVNQTNSQVLGVLNGINVSGFYQLPFSPPTSDARLAIDVQRSMGPGTNPQIFGISMLLE